MKNLRTPLYTFVLFSWLFFSCQDEFIEPVSSPSSTISDEHVEKTANYSRRDNNLAMGNPSNARNSTSNYWNYLVSRSQYSMSYHRDRGIPNWVSWHMNRDWQGNAPRSTSFRIDTSLPGNWYQVRSSDYKNTGFDRGHNCPSADRTRNQTDNKATFFMTNVVPQAPRNNQGAWASLEDYCRKLVSRGYELYVVMGSYGSGGTGNNGKKYTIANGRVTVPSRLWKVVLVLPEGSNDLNRVKTSTRVIAVDIPNSNNINSNWGNYRTTVDAIESKRNYNIFSKLPSNIQNAIESRVDNGPTR